MPKKLKKYCLLPLLFLFLSCNEDIREIEKTGNDDNVILIGDLKMSAYSKIVGSWGSHNSIWSIQEVSSDEMAITQKGTEWDDGGLWIRMHNHTWVPTDAPFEHSWVYCFTAITEINNIIKDYPHLEELNAELKILRAMIYLWLIDTFGNVPILDEKVEINPIESNSRVEVFNFIESSIENNIELLPKFGAKNQINYYSAKALLAKLYLNAEIYTGIPRWKDAEQAANAVINSGKYSLNPNFFSSFATNNGASPENILTIAYDQDHAPGFNIAQMTLHPLSQETYDLQDQPWNGYSSLEEFYNNFRDEDVRKNSFLTGPQFASDGTRLNDVLAEEGDPDGQPLTFTPYINMLAPNAFRQAGVRVGKFEFASESASSLNNDYPLIRLGEIILIKAEAAFRQGKKDDALAAINQIRTRAGVAPHGVLTLDLIFEERGFEMFAEANRRTDMIRFGKWNQPWWEKGQSEPFRALFPIPQQVLNANPNLTQNPGY